MEIELIKQITHYEGRIFTVHTNTFVNYKDGSYITRDIVVKNEVVVCMVYHTDKDRILMVKEFRVGSMKEDVGFIGGIVDEGENPMQAAIRETIEETGYTPKTVVSLGSTFTSAGFTNEKVNHFFILVDGPQASLDLDEDENIEVVEVSLQHLDSCFHNGSITSNHAHATYLKYLMLDNEI